MLLPFFYCESVEFIKNKTLGGSRTATKTCIGRDDIKEMNEKLKEKYPENDTKRYDKQEFENVSDAKNIISNFHAFTFQDSNINITTNFTTNITINITNKALSSSAILNQETERQESFAEVCSCSSDECNPKYNPGEPYPSVDSGNTKPPSAGNTNPGKPQPSSEESSDGKAPVQQGGTILVLSLFPLFFHFLQSSSLNENSRLSMQE